MNQTKKLKLENVAIANALQLEAARVPDAAQSLSALISSRAKFELAQPIRYPLRAFLLLIR